MIIDKFMNIYYRLIFYILVCCFVSCSKAPDDTNDILKYPFNKNAVWNYNETVSFQNFRPSAPGATYHETTYTYTGSVSVLGEKFFHDTIQTIMVAEISNGFLYRYYEKYYIQKPEGLYLYGYKGGGDLFAPKSNNFLRYKYKGIEFNGPKEIIDYLETAKSGYFKKGDSIYIEQDPPMVYKYPIEVGTSWNYRKTSGGSPFLINKKVIGKEFLSIHAGMFETYVVQWFYDLDTNGVYDAGIDIKDYVSSKGLIKREIIVKDIYVSNAESPEGIGLIDVVCNILVQEINMQEKNV
jgi:hypothetical protein